MHNFTSFHVISCLYIYYSLGVFTGVIKYTAGSLETLSYVCDYMPESNYFQYPIMHKINKHAN